ncbi:TetR/AcrR family transcriptional regulator [Sphingobium sp. CFD-2]|uniref:TetR/AcrR family transcriptional regulator n=1 Tax=Sphingobium sp. CFD-2 TaxID=2878542 RepID=UPI00214C887D|nr:TetR/AcrR family transcriptional regulator [Sphingobium sp. CFD-2]
MTKQGATAASKRQASFDKAKSKRRDDILAAAEALIRSTGSTDFSMKELAEAAGISTYTTYNLIGSKSTVFYILLNNSIDQINLKRLISGSDHDPVSQIFFAGSAVAEVFDADAEFYRPLMRHLLGVLDPIHRPAYMKRAFEYWLAAFAPIEEAGLLRDGVTAMSLARTVQVFFTGAIDFWVHAEVTGEELRQQIKLGLAICLQSQNLVGWESQISRMITEAGADVANLGSRLMASAELR